MFCISEFQMSGESQSQISDWLNTPDPDPKQAGQLELPISPISCQVQIPFTSFSAVVMRVPAFTYNLKHFPLWQHTKCSNNRITVICVGFTFKLLV